MVQHLLVFDRLSRGTPFLQLTDQMVCIGLLKETEYTRQ